MNTPAIAETQRQVERVQEILQKCQELNTLWKAFSEAGGTIEVYLNKQNTGKNKINYPQIALRKLAQAYHLDTTIKREDLG